MNPEKTEQESPSAIKISNVGSLFHPAYKRDGKLYHTCTYYLRYNRNGKKHQISLHTTKLNLAIKRAKEKIEALGRGEKVGAEKNQLRFKGMVELIRKRYEFRGNRSTDRLEDHINDLLEFFENDRAADITAERIEAFVEDRHGKGLSYATIALRLAALRHMFKLAELKGLIGQRPAFPELEKSKPRTGFFEKESFSKVCGYLPAEVQPVARFGYFTGWRLNEILGMKWDQVDFEGGTVRLWPGTTKNDKGRQFPFSYLPVLQDLLEEQSAYTAAVEKATGKKIAWVFHRNGRPIKSFKGAWQSACQKAEVPERIFHDLRRTAVRNLIRAGVSEHTAMLLTGHKTRSVFDRYDIQSTKDLEEAAVKLAKFHGQVQPHPEPPIIEEKKIAAGGGGVILSFPGTGRR